MRVLKKIQPLPAVMRITQQGSDFVFLNILSILSNFLSRLELVCCKKRKKIVPDKFLVWGVGDL